MDEASDALTEQLTQLRDRNKHVQGAAVVTAEGFLVASNMPDATDEEALGAQAASVLEVAQQAAQALGRGTVSELYVQGDAGLAVLTDLGGAYLLVLCDTSAMLGLLLVDVHKAAKALAGVL